MRLGQDVLSDLAAATAREWLIANGLGGTAAGTAAGANTRRSHALLIAAGPHGGHVVALLRLDERLQAGGESFDLGCALIGGASAAGGPDPEAHQARPAGHLLLEEFRADPWPAWRWRAGPVALEKTLFLLEGHDAVAVAYRHLAGPPARLIVSPVITARGPEALQRETRAWRGAARAVPGRVRFDLGPAGTTLSVWHSGSFMPARIWQRGLVYPADEMEPRPPARHPSARPSPAPRRPTAGRRAAGPVTTDTALVPGHIECALEPGGWFHLVASIQDDLFRTLAVEGRLGVPPPHTLAECVAMLEGAERERLSRWHRAAVSGADVTARQAAGAHGDGGETLARRAAPLVDGQDPWLARLAPALSDGLVRQRGRTTLLTALPAGPERGSETLRALPALITLRAFDPAREVLRGYLDYLNEGLAPEGFDAEGRPRYGDPSVSLWLVHAAELLVRRSEDLEALRDPVLPAIESIVQAYRAGTRGGIRVRQDGLLWSGEGDGARAKAEPNALWFHALVAAAHLARLAGRRESSAFYLAWAREHQHRVLETMWDEKRGCLYEALAPSGPRPGLSPSQLLAVSLAPPLLPPERAARLVRTVERELLTPCGLRAAPIAINASTAWLGPFIVAHLRVHQRSAEAQARARGWLETLRARLDERTAAHVPEAIPVPRRGDGAARRVRAAAAPPAPASVLAAAELLRVWVEELDRVEEPVASGTAS